MKKGVFPLDNQGFPSEIVLSFGLSLSVTNKQIDDVI